MDSTGTNPVFTVQDGTFVPNRILATSGGMPIMRNAGTAGFVRQIGVRSTLGL